jgi:hypothetical protein
MKNGIGGGYRSFPAALAYGRSLVEVPLILMIWSVMLLAKGGH